MPLTLTPIVEGNERGNTIVFIQGWPDDASLWDDVVADLRSDHRCVRVTLPNFAGDRSARWGHSTLEIVDALESLVREAAGGKPVVLVLHDWGCYWGHALHHRCPELVAAVAGVDVAPHYKPTLTAQVLIVGYQGWLLGAFALGGAVGDWMTRSFAKLARIPGENVRLTAWMNYPYLNIWADIFSGRAGGLTRGYWPTCPLLFVYGEKKPAQFHSAAWTDHVRQTGGEVVGLPCDHWVPRDPAFLGVLRRWLGSLPKSTLGPVKASSGGRLGQA